MKTKERRVVSRDELAKCLLDLTKSLVAEGRIVTGAFDLALPPSFELELEYKEKNGRSKFELEIIWPDREGRPRLEADQPEAGGYLAPALPRSFKETKKELERLLDNFASQAAAGRLPEIDQVGHLRELTLSFRGQAKQEWLAGIDEMTVSLDRLKDAVAESDKEKADLQIQALKTIKKKYHGIYK